ncbi:MAG TPA: carboxypeptidase regulatory-like domain-containing protein [Candidatus Eisenbacteria bacterium]|nr:carboxypeptidase regulatory-like domain-containing protein [Candidatus Eisenbacteria bacterium]
MQGKVLIGHAARMAVVFLIFAGSAWAQFSGNIQGTVTDPSGAAVAQATVGLENLVTHTSAAGTTDASGGYRFLSLAPGSYKLTVEAKGFAKAETEVRLETGQNLNVPITLKVGAATESIVVTAENPLINTAETRNQQTLQTQELSTLPLSGRNMLSLISVAPGVSGLGLAGGPGVASGTPGSGVDNFSTETAVDVSANGQGTVANMWIVDGLDVTSSIRQGVLNLTPNPDVIQETAIQVNTFSTEYGRGSGLQVALTSKSGSDQFHGLVSDYFNYQSMYAKYSLPGSDHSYSPFHSNNISATIGGPIIPHHQFFFYFGIEALRSSVSTGNTTQIFPAPEFASFAQNTFPGTFGTMILNQYVPTNINGATLNKTAADIFPDTCGTPTTFNLPCDTPMLDSGIFNSTNFRNGTQYFGRVDKYFSKDRIYGSFFRTLLNYGGPNVIPQFSTTNHNWQTAYQINYTHTFSPTTLNEFIYAQNRIEGKIGETGDFTIPGISVTGQNVGYGVGFAQGDFIQHNYHWRDVLTHVHGAHVIKVGYEGWFGDDVEPFEGPWSHPAFSFNNLLDLAQDAPVNESGVMYNPLTGQQQLWNWNAASKTWGLFAEDTWKASRNLTLTFGFRFDDQGNPYSRSEATVFGNFYLGSGSTFQDRVAAGFAKPTHNALKSSPKAYQPRIGGAWDVNGKGDWVVRGGFGVYSNWLTPANIQEEFRGNPPGLILPTFSSANADPATRPVFVQGTSSTPPFGFTFPALAGTSLCPVAPCLDAAGGIPGAGLTIGGITPNIVSPTAYVWAATLEHRIGSHLVASVLYSGSHDANLVGGGNAGGQVSYGSDINAMPGDLIGKPVNSLPTRLNPSFGAINYTQNDRVSNYNGITFDARWRASRGFFDASYTHSASKDDAGIYPTALDPHQYYGPSPWDVPNRFSLSFNYEFPSAPSESSWVKSATGGWGVSGTSIYQTGYPFNVFTSANFFNGGDYNADGDNNDWPDVTNYHQGTSRSDYISGVFNAGQFTAPTPGTLGNEKAGQFRNPAFVQTDMTIYKNTHITERLNFQFRFEFFNLFNHPNFQSIQGDLTAGNFGQVTSQTLPRWWQIGGKLTF